MICSLLNYYRYGVWTSCRHMRLWEYWPMTGFLETTYTCADCPATVYVTNGRMGRRKLFVTSPLYTQQR